MMKLKKQLALIIAGVTAFSNVYAAQINNVSYDMGTIKISGTAEKNSNVKLVVTDAKAPLDNADGLLAVKEFKSNAEGIFSSEFSISESLKGSLSAKDIILSVKEAGGIKDSKNLVYAYESEINALISEIKALESIKSAFDNVDKKRILTVIGFSVEGLEKLSATSKSEMLDIFDNEFKFPDSDGQNMAKEFNSMLGLGYINDRNEYGYFLLEAEFNDVQYVNITDSERKKYINNYLNGFVPFKNYESFYKAYDEANVLFEINNALSSALYALVDEYSGILGISDNASFIKLKGFTSYKRGNVIDNLVQSIRNTPVSYALNKIIYHISSFIT